MSPACVSAAHADSGRLQRAPHTPHGVWRHGQGSAQLRGWTVSAGTDGVVPASPPGPSAAWLRPMWGRVHAHTSRVRTVLSWAAGSHAGSNRREDVRCAHLAALSFREAMLLSQERMSPAWPPSVVYAVVTRRKLRRDILGESNTGSSLCSVSKSRASEE